MIASLKMMLFGKGSRGNLSLVELSFSYQKVWSLKFCRKHMDTFCQAMMGSTRQRNISCSATTGWAWMLTLPNTFNIVKAVKFDEKI